MKRICTHRNKKTTEIAISWNPNRKASSKGRPAAYFEKKIMFKNSPD